MAASENFAENIRKACVKLGISHRTLAERSGIHYVTVSRILNGHLDPTISTAEKLAKAAKLPLKKIFYKIA